MRDWAHSRRLGTPADGAGYVVLRQPPASKLANLFRIDVRDHALGLVTQQLGGRVTEHPPGGWLGPRTPSLREGPGSASVPSGSPDPAGGTGAPARPCGRGKLAQFSLLQRFAVWWVAPPWPILSVPAVLLALCRLVDRKLYDRSPAVRCRDGLHPVENVATASCRSRSREGEVMPSPSARAANQRSSASAAGKGVDGELGCRWQAVASGGGSTHVRRH